MLGSGGWPPGEYFAFCGAGSTFRPYVVRIAPCAVPSSIRTCAQTRRPGLRNDGMREKACGPAPILWLICLYIIMSFNIYNGLY